MTDKEQIISNNCHLPLEPLPPQLTNQNKTHKIYTLQTKTDIDKELSENLKKIRTSHMNEEENSEVINIVTYFTLRTYRYLSHIL